MVSNISLNNTIGQNSYIEKGKVATQKYVTEPVKQVAEEAMDTFGSTVKSSAQSVGLFHGLPFVSFLAKTKKAFGSLKNNELLGGLSKANEVSRNALLKGEGKLSKRIYDFVMRTEKSNEALNAVKSATKAEAKIAKLASKADKLKAAGKDVTKITAKAEEVAASAVKKKAAAEAGIQAINTGTKAVGKLAKVKNFMKSSGAGIMLAFSGFSELISEVVPTFQELGVKSGLKQLGKSAVKVVGDTAGYIGGQTIGATIGAALLSPIPVVGPFLGAALGMGCGMLGSYLAGKVTDKITGPSERKLAEQQQEQTVKQNNPFSEFTVTV